MQKIPREKTMSRSQEVPLKALELFSKVIAFVVCVGLLLTSVMIVVRAFAMMGRDLDLALQDGLFVLILLEMFYVVRSFIRFGTINVSLVVNVGIIATIKEMIFRLDNINLQLAIGFGVIFLTLGFTYFMEQFYYKKIIKEVVKEG